jgi:hypothetical protein
LRSISNLCSPASKNVSYKITGFTENSLGEVSVVLEQSYVRAEREAAQEEIDDYLESNGFRETTLSDGMPGWTNGEYEIWDAEPRNVLVDRDGNLYFIDTVVNSRRQDVNSGSDNIRFHFVGEQGAANLDRAEEANTRMDNLNVAKGMETAFTERGKRIEKLRKSAPIEISGNEIASGEDLREFRKNANQYGLDHLRDVYTNRDTGNEISVTKGSIKEVTSHDLSKEQLQSVAAIPQIIENGIYIDTLENEDREKHFDVDSYDYYVAGLKIGGADYTVRAAIANSKSGERYYDHSLTKIEKGRLILEAHAIENHGQKSNTLPGIKDTKLLSFLQTNEEENARRIKMATGWERGADGKWRYEIPDFKVSDIKTWKDGNFVGKLEDLITDADLLKAHPELKGMKADVLDLDFWDRHNEVSDGGYNPRTKEITVKYHKNDPNSPEIMRELLIHEIQHAIQDIEGFARGGNLRTANEEYRHESNMLSSAVASLEQWKDYLQDIKNGGTITSGNDVAATEKKIAEKNKWIERQIKKLVELEQAAYNAYESISGEVEARNASRRMDMTPEERRASLAAETEDVAREDQIFIYDSFGERRSADIRELDPLRIPAAHDAVFVKSTGQLRVLDRSKLQLIKPDRLKAEDVLPEKLLQMAEEELRKPCG